MDKLKFIAWDKKNKKLLPVTSITWDKFDIAYVIENGVEYDLEIDEECDLFQHTTILDECGAEVFDGHIVLMSDEANIRPGEKLIVEKYFCNFYVRPIDSEQLICPIEEACCDGLGNYKYSHGIAGKIIGHIKTDPELLEVNN